MLNVARKVVCRLDKENKNEKRSMLKGGRKDRKMT